MVYMYYQRMKKLYSFLLIVLSLAAVTGLQAQDSSRCNAAFGAGANFTQVYFTVFDTLPGITHYWNFGDGTPVEINDSSVVSHQYPRFGTYTVKQTVVNASANCRDSSTQNITVGPSCGIGINFSGDTSARVYTFIANVSSDPGTVDSVVWTINDTLAGTGDTLRKYLSGGPYTICARLSTSDGCGSQSCVTINPRDSIPTPPPPPDTCSISINAAAKTHRPNEYRFSVPDSGKYEDISWSILAPDSAMTGPFTGKQFSYTFPDTGYYLVSVSAQERSGCMVSANQWVHIDSIPGDPAGFANSYPNPASTQVTVAVTLDTYTSINIRVFNSMGGLALYKVQSGYQGINQVQIPVANLPTGVYYIEIRFGDTVVKSKIQKI